jgi:hypothetical protein
MIGEQSDQEQGMRSFVIRDLKVPRFHPEEPVLFLPEGQEVINTFADLVTAGIDPPIPYVAPAKNGAYWYLGPVALLIAVGQSSRRLVANLLPPGTPVETMKVIAAKAALLRPIHWLAEARAWKILNQPEIRESATGFYRYANTKRRRVTELLRALQTIELLKVPPPHLEHRAVSAVGPMIAALDPEFASTLLCEAERHQWSVRQVLRLSARWEASAASHWRARLQRGLPRLTTDEEARLAAAGLDSNELPTGWMPDAEPSYPLGARGLAKLLEGMSSPEPALTA